ncbi:MAG: hypothetical protein LQ351_007998 [Letrouitia transgressa]|nr:MAG: hypothetical protein LQ351_007998 [Letrouitia transgressa]
MGGDPQDKEGNSIPSWQCEDAPPQPTSSEEQLSPSTSSTDESQSSLPRAALIDQATKFLDEDDVKTAPTERKIRFLQIKGLTEHEIHQLLNLSRDENHILDAEEQPNTFSRSPSQSDPPKSSPEDTVPIITYPEFLLHTQKPPPLITTSRLLSAFYILASTSATLYGTNEYLVTPMLDSLSASRHSLFSTALENLSTLNSKLSTIVSLPSTLSSAQDRANAEPDMNASPLSPSTSSNDDICPIFSRTIGTQTSPQPPSSPSHPATPPLPEISAIVSQESKLKMLHTTLSSLLSPKQDDTLDVRPSEKIRELRSYLDGLVYPGLGLGSGFGSGVIVKGDDAVGRVRAEVRGVKGVLLNARNFPGVR